MDKRNFSRSERGQSFLELAISLTFLFVLLAGTIDVGRAFFTFISLRDAVQEGASYAAITPFDCVGAVMRVREQSDQPINLSTDPSISVTVRVKDVECTNTTAANTPHPDYFCPGDPITVTITYTDFQIAMPFMGAIIGKQSLPLTATVSNAVLIDPDPVSSPCSSTY